MQVANTASLERFEKHLALFSTGNPPRARCLAGVVVVIPAYDEARFIGSVVLEARRYAETVLVVDDGSADGTARIAQAAGAVVLEMPQNGGKGAAIRSGLQVVLHEEDVRAIVLLDGDGQHDPKELTRLVQPIFDQDADLVIGSRFLGVRSRIPWWRQIGQHGLTWLTNAASCVESTDSQSGYRALSPQAAHFLLQTRSEGFSIESAMQFVIREHSIRVTEVPISCTYAEPAKRNPVSHGLQVIDGILRLVAQMRPLLFFGVPSIVLLLLGLTLGFIVIQIYDAIGELAVGYALLTLLLTVVGAIGLSSGIILHSIRGLLSDALRTQRKP